jgi:hypothetical protein
MNAGHQCGLPQSEPPQPAKFGEFFACEATRRDRSSLRALKGKSADAAPIYWTFSPFRQRSLISRELMQDPFPPLV